MSESSLGNNYLGHRTSMEFERQAAALAPEVNVQVLAPGASVSVCAAPDNSVPASV